MMRPIIAALAVGVICAASDWPRFGGPDGDFRLAGETELSWPADGPKLLWKRALGNGWSSIVSQGSALYTMYRQDEREVVVSLDAGTGKTLWEFAYDAPLPKDFDRSNGTGPRATPLLAGDLLFTVGAGAKMYALERSTGHVKWTVDLVKQFDGQVRINGYAPSPVAWNDTVIVMPNGPGAAIAALRQSDGKVIWKRHSYVVSYATPMVIEFGGHAQLVAEFSDEVVGLDPANGDILWSHAHTNTEKVSVALPVWRDGTMFLSNAYDGGSRMLRLSPDGGKTKIEQVWAHRQVRVHHGNAVRIGETVYAASGDSGAAPLAALDWASGAVLWRDRQFPKASIVAVGKQLLILDEDGTLALATPTPKGLEVAGKVAALKERAWTPPTVVGKKVYLRDGQSIVAYEFK